MLKVLRLGHRIGRDPRLTTHLLLAARAIGADGAIVTGEKDNKIFETINGISSRWGGAFAVTHSDNYKKTIAEHKKRGFAVVHLTMYGLPVRKVVGKLRKRNLLVIVGGEKVPADVYQLSDYNVSVGNQPHSEVAALAIFLHEYFEGKELTKKFSGRIVVKPNPKGKTVIKKK